MKILLLCNKMPYPPVEGGPIAMNAIINGLASAGHELKVLALKSSKFGAGTLDIPEDYHNKTRLEYTSVDLRVKPLPALKCLLKNESYHVKRFISTSFNDLLVSVLRNEDFDIVQLETMYMTPYVGIIRKYSGAKIVLRSHNIEHKIWERILSQERNILKKAYLFQLSGALKKYEVRSAGLYDGIAAITGKDAEWYRSISGSCPIHIIPFGLEIKPVKEAPSIENSSLFHIGSMDWMPNLEGIKWFIENVWPLVNTNMPGLTLYLAGRNMPEWLASGHWPGIEMEGEILDASEFMRSKGILVVPLLSGSGVRIKILEAMRMGIPVISTTIGAEGIGYINGKNIIIADEPHQWVGQIRIMIDDKQKCEAVGRAGLELVKQQHDIHNITGELIQFYRDLIRKES